ncbi:hypothetical protein ACFL5V_08320 [Fibrobacterota bacterium]
MMNFILKMNRKAKEINNYFSTMENDDSNTKGKKGGREGDKYNLFDELKIQELVGEYLQSL